MEQVVANIYAACLSAEAEPHAELVDLAINAIQDGLAGPNKDETLGAIFTAVQELTQERQQKGALFRIKLTAIAAAAKALPQNTRDALLKSLRAMGEVARQQALSATSSTITLLVDSISKIETAVGHPSPPPAPPKPEIKAEASKVESGMMLQDYLKQHARHAGSDKIAFAPDIPLKKISGALNSIGGYVKAEDVVVVIDDTVFGGSKEGVFITNDRIFVKEAFTDLAIYRLDSIHHIGAEGRKVFINHRQIVSMSQPEKGDLELLFSVINDFLALSHPQPAAAPTQGTRAAPAPAYAPPPEEEMDASEIDGYHGFFFASGEDIWEESEEGSQPDKLLMIHLLNAGTHLQLFLTNQGLHLGDQAEWAATSDAAHLESLLYVAELSLCLMATKIRPANEDLQDFEKYLYGHLIFPYMTTLPNVSAAERELHERFIEYRRLMREEPTGLPKFLQTCLLTPMAIYAYSGEEQEDLIAGFFHLRAEALNEERTFAYLRHISEMVDNAMATWAGNVVS